MRSARVRGIELEYQVVGAGEPVLLIHGVLIAEAFQPLLGNPELSERYQLIAPRRRGYGGGTGSLTPTDIAGQAADAHALLRHLGVVRAHVVGHSFGGAVALQLALDAPGLVQTLSLLEPALMVLNSGPAYRQSLADAVSRYHAEGAGVAVDAMLSARWPEYRVGLERSMPGAFQAALAGAQPTYEVDLPSLLNWTFAEAEAKRIEQPVLSVLGAESVRLNPRFAEAHDWSLTHFPDAEGFILPGAHHFLQLENPGDLARALDAFFAKHPIELSNAS